MAIISRLARDMREQRGPESAKHLFSVRWVGTLFTSSSRFYSTEVSYGRTFALQFSLAHMCVRITGETVVPFPSSHFWFSLLHHPTSIRAGHSHQNSFGDVFVVFVAVIGRERPWSFKPLNRWGKGGPKSCPTHVCCIG